MIDAWDVYWVMQLDSIGSTVSLMGTVGIVVCLLATAWGLINKSTSLHYPELEMSKREAAIGSACIRLAIRIGIVCVPLVFLSALIPSSKTAAAMIVLPAITSDTVVQTLAPEARELYELAKDALRSVAKDKAVEPKPAE